MSAQPAGGGLERLRELLRDSGGLVAGMLDDGVAVAGPADGALDSDGAAPAPRGGSRPARLAGQGPRAEGRREQYELLVEAIYEGYLLHYRRARLLRVPREEEGLGLLAGDQLYAIGLAQLMKIGDQLAVSELADTITLSALAQAAGSEQLAEAVWEAGARAVGWGSSETHRRAKELACEGSPEALDAMRTSARVISG